MDLKKATRTALGFANTEAGLALVVIIVLFVLIVPLPTLILDVLLSVNIALALLMLLVTLSAGAPLDVSTFPSLLLLLTLFRLALNVASTRLILLHAFAGNVIQAFGNFVVGGNVVVGMVVFLILVVIQFVVITKGAGRISEVAARFTLDAMPGKQMSIDADLNAGLINDEDARVRRELITREAEFYGAMDGACKFVRGDAIAGLVITGINLFGGIVIGLSRDLTVAEAGRTYSVLTVGDGLVSQIPSLIIATAAGIITTKASSQTSLGDDVSAQIFMQYRPLALAAAMLAIFGVVPGLPALPFLVLAAAMGGLSLATRRADQRRQIAEDKQAEEERRRLPAPEDIQSQAKIDRLAVELGFKLIPMADPNKSHVLLNRISSVRREIARKLGLVVPRIHIRDNLELASNAYSIRIRGQEVAEGELTPGQYLAMDSGDVTERIPGKEVQEPAFGLPAVWIEATQKDAAELSGYATVAAPDVLATHLMEVIKRHAAEILSREDVQSAADGLKETDAAVVEELIPNKMKLGGVQRVLGNLLREGVPINDLATIFEVLGDYAADEKDVDRLTEFVRERLARTICNQYKNEKGQIGVIALHPETESAIAQALQGTQPSDEATIGPGTIQQIVESVSAAIKKTAARGYEGVVLTSGGIRRYVKAFLEGAVPGLAVLSYNEIADGVKIELLETVKVEVG